MRSSWLFGPTGHNFVRTMLRLAAERDEVSVVDDQRGSPTYVGHLAAATRQVVELPYGVYHVAADGDATWADFAEAIFEEAGLDTRVRRIATAELDPPRKAPRPAYSVLRSEKGAPELPHWRDGLRECLAAIRAGRRERIARGWRATRSSPPGSWTRRATTCGRRSTRSSAGRSGGGASGACEQLEEGDADGDRRPLPARVAERHPVPGPLRRADHADRAARPDRGRRGRRARRSRPLALLRRAARRRSPTSGTCARPSAWMNLAAPLARPIFRWNHNVVMHQGGKD